MHSATRQIIAGILIYFLTIFQVFGQAALLPNAEQQYFNNNGQPLASGTVTYYVPGTTTKKTTWQNSAQSINNTNPVNLDIGGKGIMYGQGSYRQVVQDSLGNTIWDQVTTAYGSSAPSGATGTDTAPVGTVMAYTGFVVPTNWQLAYGQALSRTTFAQLMTAITISAPSISCTQTSATLTGFTDTSIIRVGAPIEATCLNTSTTVASIVNATTITVSNAAAATQTVTATIFPWGNGDQVTTFNVPDLRGRSAVGADCMGYVAAGNTCGGNLTATYYGAIPGAAGQTGGSQSQSLTLANISPFVAKGTISQITPAGTITNGAITITQNANSQNNAGLAGSGANALAQDSAATITASQAASTFAGTPVTPTFTGSSIGGGVAVSATLGAAGSSYPTSSTVTLTLTGGTCSTAPQFSMNTNGSGNLTGSPTLVTAGACSVVPANPAATSSSATGSGGTLNVTWSVLPVSVVNPDATVNYIIKVAPNNTGAGGVVSFGGMVGDIVCNSTLTCAPVASINTVGCTAASNSQLGCVQTDGVTTLIVGGLLTAVAGVASSVGVGSTAITGGASGNIEYNNGGVFGELTTSGTGSVCMTVSCVMTTPNIGAATATSVNGNIFSGSGWTLAGLTGKLLTFDNSLTLAGIDSTTLTFQGTDTYVGRATTDTLTNKTLTSPAINSATITGGTLAGTIAGTPTLGGSNFITFSNIVQDATAWSLLGNATGSAGNYAPFTIGGLTQKASPASTDFVMIQDQSASGQLKYATVSSIASAGSVASVNTKTGALTLLTQPQGRLTLVANLAVMTTSQSAVGTLHYTCAPLNQVPYYTGSADGLDTIASCDVNTAMVSATSAGQVVSGNLYDVWWEGNTNHNICLAMSSSSGGGGGWSSDTGGSNTSRGTGYTQLDFTTRPYITNKNSISNCFNGSTNYGSVSANKLTYLGTVYASGNGQVSYLFGAFGAPPTAALFGVFNAYNRVNVGTCIGETTSSWTYNVATTWREARGDSAYNIGVVRGLNEDGVSVVRTGFITAGSATSGAIGIGLNSTTAFASGSVTGFTNAPTSVFGVTASYASTPGVGLNTFNALEWSTTSTASTYYGSTANGLNEGMCFNGRL